ncbi:MAG: dTDP-glucose 4,6-dehydratase, partial [Candidatus Neomarinimicrobiota bacterium]|nr:dTDP-glucose 4,6-dehydratase [Candidatus Neomarinimicrobiota bacterium]
PTKSLKQYSDLITFVSDRPGHDFRYSIDTTKIKNELNWGPEESFDTGLLKTIKWYLDNEIWWKKIQNHVYNQERLGIES